VQGGGEYFPEVVAKRQELERKWRLIASGESLRVLDEVHEREEQFVSLAGFQERLGASKFARRILPLDGEQIRVAAAPRQVEPDGLGIDGGVECVAVGARAPRLTEASQPRQDGLRSVRIRQRPQGARAVLRKGDVTVEFSRPGKGPSCDSRRFFGSVRITGGRDQRAENAEILFVYQTVLIQVDAACQGVGHREGIAEKGVEGSEVAVGPPSIAVKIAKHDQFGVNYDTVYRYGQFPIGIADREESAGGERQPLPCFHLRSPGRSRGIIRTYMFSSFDPGERGSGRSQFALKPSWALTLASSLRKRRFWG